MVASLSVSCFAMSAKAAGQGGVVGLRGEFLGPVEGEVEVAAAVVDAADPSGRGFVLVQEGAGGPVQGVGEDLGLGVAGGDRQMFQAGRQGQELPEAVPAQVVLLDQLLDVFGGRAAGAGLEQAAAVDQRHHRQHLGRGAEFEDREQVGQVVPQHVAGDRDGVLALADPVQRVRDRLDRGLDRDVQTVGVVVGQILLDLGDQRRRRGRGRRPARTPPGFRWRGPG